MGLIIISLTTLILNILLWHVGGEPRWDVQIMGWSAAFTASILIYLRGKLK
jgi:hypothetical protein